MVLQRGKPIPVWGTAGQNEKFTLTFHDQKLAVTANAAGKWKIELRPEKEGGPYTLSLFGSAIKKLNDIWVGDVWLCSGQSNMEFTVASANNSKEEIASANNFKIRHLMVPKAIGDKPKEDIVENIWHTANPAFVGGFTAVGYYFAKEIYNQTHVPIGLLHTSWGGTEVETWISREALSNNPEFKELMGQLPVMNLDSLADVKNKLMLEKIKKVQTGLPTAEVAESWKEPFLDDQSWPKMQLPGLWEQTVLPDLDGIVYLRKTVMIPATEVGKTGMLSLSMIDDNDVTYINGVKVGNTNGYNIKRVYTIQPGVLKPGKNVIVIRIEDTGGGGGVYGEATDLTLSVGNNKQDLRGEWHFQIASLGKASAVGPNSYPTLLYNAMLHPLLPFAIKGALWYQGESNAGRAYQYRKAFPLMITDWRTRFKQGDFPFYFVQLASFNSANGNSENGSNWAELREAQTLTLKLPHTGMAVTTDIGESKDIHPKNKQDVGKRLAAWSLHDDYGKQGEFTGPIYSTHKIVGNTMEIQFSHAAKGFTIKGASGKILGFEIAGADKKFYPAEAVIKGNLIVVSSDKVATPASVHFGWADDAGICNLFNKEGFPASPFRTDNWKGKTDDVKYKITLK
jgi:sialate O-acetylesterase